LKVSTPMLPSMKGDQRDSGRAYHIRGAMKRGKDLWWEPGKDWGIPDSTACCPRGLIAITGKKRQSCGARSGAKIEKSKDRVEYSKRPAKGRRGKGGPAGIG